MKIKWTETRSITAVFGCYVVKIEQSSLDQYSCWSLSNILSYYSIAGGVCVKLFWGQSGLQIRLLRIMNFF